MTPKPETIPPATPVITPPAPAPEPEIIPPVEPVIDPAEPVVEPVEPPVEPPVEDHLLAAVLRGLNPEPEPVEVEPAPEPVVEPVPPVVEPVVPPPAPAPAPPKKVVKTVSSKGHTLVTPEPTPPAPPVAELPPAPPAPVETLTDEQREELEEAMVAERLFPDRYRGQAESLKKWYGDFDRRAAALLEKNPDVTPEDAEYQALLRSKPVLKPVDARRAQKKIGEDMAVARSRAEIEPKLDQLAMDTRRAAVLPEVQNYVSTSFSAQIRSQIAADPKSLLTDAVKLVMEKGFEAAAQEFPLECRVMKETAMRSQARLSEFLLMTNRAARFDPANPVHKSVADFINWEGEQKVKAGDKYDISLPREKQERGRQFLPRAQFIAMLGNDQAEKRTFNNANWNTAKYWTFNDAEIVDMMAIRTKEEAEFHVKNLQEQAKRDGYERVPKKPVAAPQTPASEIRPPQSRAAAAPGPVTPPKTADPADDSPIPLATLVNDLKIVK